MGAKSPIMKHFRRCHVCGAVTERNERIDQCDHCGKWLVPFFYYDEVLAPPASDDQERPLSEPGEYRLVGLSVSWVASSARTQQES